MKDFFIKTALLLSQKSKCVSKKVGSVIVHDDRIISMGYNGTPSGFKNCCDQFNQYDRTQREEHHKWSDKYELHSELNSIIFCAKHGINIQGSEIYVTLFPCDQCIKNLIQSGIMKIYYLFEYDKGDIENPLLQYVEIECLLNEDIKQFIKINNLIKLV